MSYTDEIECPHCHKTIELEVEIEYGGDDDIYAVINPIQPKAKGVINCRKDKETFLDQLELERRLGK